MKPRSAKKSFLQRLQQAGKKLASLLPSEGIDLMLDFYSVERADGCSLDEEGDMLLYQWGTNDWGNGAWFELNITRQFMTSEEDAEIRQLSLTFQFEPSPALKRLASGNRWCSSLDELRLFRGFIRASRPFAAVGSLQAAQVTLTYGAT